MTSLWDHDPTIASVTKLIATVLGEGTEAIFHALNHLAANDNRVRKQSGKAAAADTFVLT